MAKLLKLIMKESIQSASDTLQKIKEIINSANSSLKPDIKNVYITKNANTNKYDIMLASNDGNSIIASVEYSKLPEEDLKELNILKEETTESVVLRDEAEKVINESEDEDLEKFMDEYYQEIMDSYNAEMAAAEDMDPEEYAAQDNPIDSEVFDLIAQSMYDEYNKTESMKEDYYLNINDGKQEDADYLIQDVTELEDLSDEDVESPSIDGLLSLVNESLTEKYGTTWGYMKAHSIAKKESLQYAIIDIVTPSILKEAEQAKIKDKAVSKTVILENVPNSKKLVNLKVNTLAGTTRFSQKTAEPAKVFARWLESEYLYDEMVKDFQDKLLARQQELKASTDNYLKEHPDLALRVDTLNAQAKILKDANMMDTSKSELQNLMYGLVSEFPFNTSVEESKDEYSQSFDTTDKLVEMLFGKEFVKEDTTPDNKIEKTKTKHKVVSTKVEKIKESSSNSGMYINEYYSSLEDAKDAEKILKHKGHKTKIKKSGNEYELWCSYETYKESSLKESNSEADKLIKDYFNHKMDLEDLHNKLEKLFGNKKDAVEYLRKNENRVKSLKESEITTLKKGDKLSNGRAEMEIIDVDNEHKLNGQPQVTYRFNSGETKCYPINSVVNMLNQNSYKFLNESSLKEGYESFKIGEIEGTFNPDTLEVMYSIPSENVKDKKINLTKVPSVETPYNTDTIIKDYVEKNYGNIPAEDNADTTDVNINADDVNIENEPSTPAPTEDNSDEGEADLDMNDEEVTEADELPEEPVENTETPAENSEESQSETGTGSFYKVRQREPVNIDNLLEKSANGTNTQESEYIVVKTEELPQEDMDNLLSDLSKPQSFLQNVEPIDRKNYAFNVVKVTSPSSPYTLFIDPVGYNYPRYISISQ